MVKFKAGDKAVLLSVEPGWGVAAGTEVTIKEPFISSAGPGYWVELCDEPGSRIYYTERRLGPVDDPLPPAPKSVMYLKEEGQRKLTASMYPSSVSIKIHLEYPGTVKCLGYSMEPDAALQLAHDLTRMAMEIKRKEKQNA